MRFMMLMIPAGEAYEAGSMPSADQVAKMMKYNEDLQKAGILISLEGLHAPAEGARVAFKNGAATVIDGPFTESKEVLGGFWMIDVPSQADAIAWARKCPAEDGNFIDIRQVFEMSEFPQDVQDAAADFEQSFAPKG